MRGVQLSMTVGPNGLPLSLSSSSVYRRGVFFVDYITPSEFVADLNSATLAIIILSPDVIEI